MLKKCLLTSAVTATMTLSGAVLADSKNNSFNFTPIDGSANAADWDATAPWKLPRGYTQEVVSDETDLNIYDGGRLLEIELNDDLVSGVAMERPAVGLMAHEGIDIDETGNIYVVDEHRGQTSGCVLGTPCGGGIYKFVPHYYGDLSSGDLYALKVTGPDGIGQGEWVGPIDPANVRQSGTEAGGTSYQRPEDVEIINSILYVAITEGPRAQGVGSEVYEGRVIAVDLDTLMVTNFVKPGVNVPVKLGRPGQDGFQTGFDSIDNLAEAPNGDLVMVKDNVPSDIWFASTKTDKYGASVDVELFASLTDDGAEGTGIYFSPLDPNTLYVNVQHSKVDDGDATWAIRRKGEGHWK